MSFFNNFTKQLQSGLEEVQKEAQKFQSDFTPIAKRTARLVQEKFGTIEDISELPEEYILLEKKVDALRQVYKKVLAITATYEIESYDYPPNIQESVSDLSKTLAEKFKGLQKATTAAEAEKALTSSSTDPLASLPKTLAHEISKAAKQSHDNLIQFGEENALSKVLLKFSEAQSKIGTKRLEQDQMIITEFNKKLQDALDKNFQETQSNRKKVEAARLNFDTLRYEVKINPEKQESLQGQLDTYEDELVNATTVAVQSMKKLIEPAESVNLIILFNKIQLQYHKAAAAELESLIKDLEAVPLDEEDDEEDEEEE
ncbi:CYFA0S01e05688g1_1 [Cyberlindnera fabianii]|uniref:CYFA0S01e05688g1_1 n=1 Tax=Cyberlindnera fabianii TaxID=36022 RepID=A0A061ANP2_CYBFA|nr:Protein GVP36 [Cyberlindnera fabianii]CDR36934.1 CYFA0S01e05688g1_1 [Cyberlindnera fabianii]